VLSITNLTKTYGSRTAVKDLTLHARAGEVIALLGPNGAGKTTAIKCVTGVAAPSGGSVLIDGHDIQRAPVLAKSAIGYVPDRAWFYQKLTGRETLRFISAIRKQPHQLKREQALLTRFRLTDAADARVETYSHGMRQRLAFCCALLPRPRLFIADEPMVGLDVQGHRDARKLFRELADQGNTVLLTTHTLSVAEEVADRIALIDHGTLIALGTMNDLRALTSLPGANLEDLFLALTQDNERTP
jgi:ABC-2 type transport system ATP-binding protein